MLLFFHSYLANVIIPLVKLTHVSVLCVQSSCPDVGDTEPLYRLSFFSCTSSLTSWLAYDTDLSSALCLTLLNSWSYDAEEVCETQICV